MEPESPEIQRGAEEPEPTHPLQRIKLLSESDPGDTNQSNDSSDINQDFGSESTSHSSAAKETKCSEKLDICDKNITSSEKQTENSEVESNDKRRSSVRRTLSESYGDLDDVKTHCRSSSSSSSHSNPQIPNTDKSSALQSKDPLANMNTITHLESVQTGKTISSNDSVLNIEDLSENLGKLDSIDDLSDSEKEKSIYERSLNLDDSTELLKRSGSIEELDSPESILKIDQEDCFSWEEDRLLLSIDHKEDAEQGGEKDTTKSKTEVPENDEEGEIKKDNSENVQEKVEGVKDNTSHNGEIDTKINDSGFSSTESNYSKNNSREVTPDKEVTRSPGGRKAAIKNKLSSALRYSCL